MGKKTKMILSLGAIISLPIILMSVIAYAFDLSDAKWFGWISMLVFVLSIVFVQRYYRNNFYGGYISYSKLLGGTMLMVLIALSISTVFSTFIQGFIVALISSAFIKKNTDAFAEAMKGVENE
ncbi:MAG: DUF4199 family protein [Bacteroidota bacterium]|jgi:hypothetical protein|nr:DUF4199 family protein [Bacteroidales bacterium]MDI9535960.1 DUF4199 family protein [Bacteroidota bacterium]HNY44713.1 DUF4199 family protein [Bacteroidales bacterium]